MKFLPLLFVLLNLHIYGQDSLNALTGQYQAVIDPTLQFIIKKENQQLILELPGQGQTDMVNIGSDRFQPNHITPVTTITFLRDNTGNVRQFSWQQDHGNQASEWKRLPADAGIAYTGVYQLKDDPYKQMVIREEKGVLRAQLNGGPLCPLQLLPDGQYRLSLGKYHLTYRFTKDRQGRVQGIVTRESGNIDFIRQGVLASSDGGFHRVFNRADSLRGMLTPLRSCYDVLFYGLDVTVTPATKSIRGSTAIRFKAVQSFDRMQVDLYANMHIDKILFHGRELPYTREYNAVFVSFPLPISQGTTEEIIIQYNGQPQLPDLKILKGGFFWYQDRQGLPWIESVCQGSGASLWWPCKDHLSDEPDSMRISITVPTGLKDISNGRLLDTVALPGGKTRFNWYVDYPINNYDVVVNIGNYMHFSAQYDSMPVYYYCMPYNLAKAKKIFAETPRMLSLYEKDFGPYPFKRDGFTLMESLYPMEHQGAVSIGPVNNPVNSDNTDYTDLERAVWHESAHEWWGNSITCKDMADLWIHEAFAQYAEVLAYEFFQGPDAAKLFLSQQIAENKEPVIGFYNVNDFHLGDMYPKGCLMLHTLRNVISDDSSWFALLRGLQQRYRYQTVTTEDIVAYINEATQHNYTSFFDQYLKHGNIPELELDVKTAGDGLNVRYKWNVDVSGFDMPIKVTTSPGHYAFIYPGTEFKTITLAGIKPEDFKVDTDDFYIRVKQL